MARPLELSSYRLLGRSGLCVSPLALGTMTFGADWGCGADESEAHRMFDVAAAVAAETGHSAAQVAIGRTLTNPAVAATLLGARTLKQLEDNLGALEVSLDAEHCARLDQASAIVPGFPTTSCASR
jgi:aryl-alcohol dehydrogenase-like predicted oxidoreductase